MPPISLTTDQLVSSCVLYKIYGLSTSDTIKTSQDNRLNFTELMFDAVFIKLCCIFLFHNKTNTLIKTLRMNIMKSKNKRVLIRSHCLWSPRYLWSPQFYIYFIRTNTYSNVDLLRLIRFNIRLKSNYVRCCVSLLIMFSVFSSILLKITAEHFDTTSQICDNNYKAIKTVEFFGYISPE